MIISYSPVEGFDTDGTITWMPRPSVDQADGIALNGDFRQAGRYWAVSNATLTPDSDSMALHPATYLADGVVSQKMQLDVGAYYTVDVEFARDPRQVVNVLLAVYSETGAAVYYADESTSGKLFRSFIFQATTKLMYLRIALVGYTELPPIYLKRITVNKEKNYKGSTDANLYTEASAVNQFNEANSVGAWVCNNTAPRTFAVSTVNPLFGTYCLDASSLPAGGSGNSRVTTPLPAGVPVAGDVYRVTYYLRHTDQGLGLTTPGIYNAALSRTVRLSSYGGSTNYRAYTSYIRRSASLDTVGAEGNDSGDGTSVHYTLDGFNVYKSSEIVNMSDMSDCYSAISQAFWTHSAAWFVTLVSGNYGMYCNGSQIVDDTISQVNTPAKARVTYQCVVWVPYMTAGYMDVYFRLGNRKQRISAAGYYFFDLTCFMDADDIYITVDPTFTGVISRVSMRPKEERGVGESSLFTESTPEYRMTSAPAIPFVNATHYYQRIMQEYNPRMDVSDFTYTTVFKYSPRGGVVGVDEYPIFMRAQRVPTSLSALTERGPSQSAYVNATGNVVFRVVSDTPVVVSITSTRTIQPGDIASVTAVKRGTVMELWINGTLDITATAPTGLMFQASIKPDIELGGYGLTGEAANNLDFLYFNALNSARTPQNIAESYQRAKRALDSGLPPQAVGGTVTIAANDVLVLDKSLSVLRNSVYSDSGASGQTSVQRLEEYLNFVAGPFRDTEGYQYRVLYRQLIKGATVTIDEEGTEAYAHAPVDYTLNGSSMNESRDGDTNMVTFNFSFRRKNRTFRG